MARWLEEKGEETVAGACVTAKEKCIRFSSCSASCSANCSANCSASCSASSWKVEVLLVAVCSVVLAVAPERFDTVLLGTFATLCVNMIQAFRGMTFRRYGSSPRTQSRALRFLTFSEVRSTSILNCNGVIKVFFLRMNRRSNGRFAQSVFK